MGATSSFRPDPESAAALEYLETRWGLKRSEAIRRGVIELADRARSKALRAEVEALANDPADREEKRAVTRLMDSLAPSRYDE